MVAGRYRRGVTVEGGGGLRWVEEKRVGWVEENGERIIEWVEEWRDE